MPQSEVIEAAGTIAALKVDGSAEGSVPPEEHAFLAAPHLYIMRNARGEAGSPRIRQTTADWQIFEQECGGRLSLFTTGRKQRQDQQRRKKRSLPTGS
jgi:hypothetical protein